MHFGEFNPLDVLANAAVQQSEPTTSSASASSESVDNTPHKVEDTEEEDNDVKGGKTEEEEVKEKESESESKGTASTSTMVAPLVTDAGNSKPLALQSPLLASNVRSSPRMNGNSGDTTSLTKIVIPNKDGKSSKTLTVLKMKPGSKIPAQGSEHAYAYLCQVDGATKPGKTPEDDEGYCSRSSLDSPGQSSRLDSDAFEQESTTGFESQKSPVIRPSPMSPPPPPRVTSPRPTRTGLMAPPSIKTHIFASPASLASAQKTDNKPKTVVAMNHSVLKPPVAPVALQSKENELVAKQTKTDNTASKAPTVSTTPTTSLQSSSSSPSPTSSNTTTTSTPTPAPSPSTIVATSTSKGSTKTEPVLAVSQEAKTDIQTVSPALPSPATEIVKEETVATEEQEEVIDVTSFMAPVDQSLVLVTSATTLPATPSLTTTAQVTTVPTTLQLPKLQTSTTTINTSSTTPPSSSPSGMATKSVTLSRQVIDPSAKRVPLLINTSIGHKVTNPGGAVTYLLVPPPSTSGVKGSNGTGGLVLSQLGTKNQYIIQDDLPPATKLSNGVELGTRLSIRDNTRLTSAPTHAKPVSLLSKPVKPSGTVLCINANTGQPMFQASSPSQLGLFANKITSSSSSVSSSSSSQSSSSQSLLSSSLTSSTSTTTTSTTLHSLENPEKQINIKISGSKVIDMASLQEVTAPAGKKQAACIGNLGSISLTKIDNASPVSPRTVSPLSRTVSPLSLSAASSSFSPIGSVAAGSRSHTPLSMGGGDTISLFSPTDLESPLAPNAASHSNTTGNNAGKSNMSARTCHTYVKRKNSASSGDKGNVGVDVGGMRLHPLIDHDYCMFTEFSAEIQSSIIATTESKLKTERKYNKKTKAARCTKVLRTPPPDKAPGRKKRKYTRRIPLEKLRQQRSVESTTLSIPSPSSVDSMDIGSPESGLSSPTPLTPLKPESPVPKSVAESKIAAKGKSPSKRRDGRNYVKITGSYQDEFVYFATKKTSGRPRKYHDSVASQASTESMDGGPQPPQQSTPATVQGVNVFDWYRDLSNTDKSSKFGMDSDTKIDHEDSVVPEPVNQIPQHDSDVVDLVMEMANESNSSFSQANLTDSFSFPDSHPMQSETVITTPSDEMKPLLGSDMVASDMVGNDMVGNDMVGSPAVHKSETLDEDIKPKVDVDTAPGTPAMHHDPPINDHPVIDDAMMAEVQDMLSSMGEEELKILTQNLSSDAVHDTPVKSESVDHGLSFLGSYNTEMPVHQSSTGAFDLDDIAHSDLLHIEPTSKLDKDLFPDMCRPSESPLKHMDMVDKADPQTELDRSELFPDITTSSAPAVSSSSVSSMPLAHTPAPALAPHAPLPGNASPPELTTVHMYWNDLPGLMLNGRQHVRLVDIHKQMLPAKDTGILKKRCQMMHLRLVNCSELERDFLVRYAHAAKSKSTVLVSKEDATALVSFYVEPRPRAPRNMGGAGGGYVEDTDSMQGPMDDQALVAPGIKSALGGKLKLKMKLKAEENMENGSVDDSTHSPPSTGGKTRRPSTNPRKRPPSLSSSSPLDDDEAKRSGRTRHKKVNYAALHTGGYEDGPKLVSSESEVSLAESQASTMTVMSTTTVTGDQNEWVETVEIEKLIEKRRAQGGQLSKVDNEKLIYWRDRIKLRIKEKNDELEEKKKSRRKTVTEETEITPDVESVTDDQTASEFIEVVSPGQPEVHVTDACTETSTQTGVVEDVNVEDPEEEADVEAPVSEIPSVEDMPPIVVHHRDNTSRGTMQQRGRWQEGSLKLSAYNNRDSPCITCITCRETFSVKKFIKHLHHQNKIDELCEVTLVQKLEPKSPAPMLTWQIWEQFEKRQAQFEEIALREKQVLKLQRQEQNAANRPAQRLSGRARKRKQLHPMESYVYADSPNKRARYDSESINQTTEHNTSENKERITQKDAAVHVEKVR